MTSSISCLKGLKNLALYTTLGSVRPQVLSRSLCSRGNEEQLSNLQRVAQQYKEIYDSRRSKESEREKKDPKDRREVIPVETSIRYLKSTAYKNTYGTEPVWVPYRRNFKGQFPPLNTRVKCIGPDGFLKTGNPCPICRDEYLILHYKNVELLKQFISPYNGSLIECQRTNLCRQQHDQLCTAIMEAKELGLLIYDVPFRVYDYDRFKPKQPTN